MPSHLRSFCNFSLILITCLQPCCAAPFVSSLGSLSLPSLSTALERMADYGYSMANYGYSMLGYNHVEPDHVIVKDKKTIWDGHIGIPDFVSPLLGQLDDMSYSSDSVVKGHDGRLGFRAAIPYFGDIQYIREIGPGRFTDKLGPGTYEYPGLNGRPKKEEDHGYAPPPYSPPAPDHHVSHEPVYPQQMYQGLQNYPWNV